MSARAPAIARQVDASATACRRSLRPTRNRTTRAAERGRFPTKMRRGTNNPARGGREASPCGLSAAVSASPASSTAPLLGMSFQKYVSGKPVVQVYLLDNSFRQLLIEPSSTVHVRRRRRRLFSPARAGLQACPAPRRPPENQAPRHPYAKSTQDVTLMMARKVGMADPEDDCLLFSLNEALDGVTSEKARSLPGLADRDRPEFWALVAGGPPQQGRCAAACSRRLVSLRRHNGPPSPGQPPPHARCLRARPCLVLRCAVARLGSRLDPARCPRRPALARSRKGAQAGRPRDGHPARVVRPGHAA